VNKRTDSDELITQAEAARIRKVSLPSINELVRRGRLRSVERYGKKLVYRSEVLGFEPEKGGRGLKASGGRAIAETVLEGEKSKPTKPQAKKPTKRKTKPAPAPKK
jgi:hypothetical protein